MFGRVGDVVRAYDKQVNSLPLPGKFGYASYARDQLSLDGLLRVD